MSIFFKKLKDRQGSIQSSDIISPLSSMNIPILYADGSVYTWTQVPFPIPYKQTDSQITVILKVPGSYQTSDAAIKFHPDAFTVSLSSASFSPAVSGTLFEKINTSDCIWQIEDDEVADTRTLTITLEKAIPNNWAILIKGGSMDPQSEYELGNYYQALEEPSKAVDL